MKKVTKADDLLGKHIIIPDWPAPPSVKSMITTRYGGVSLPPFNSFNIATHVGDSEHHIVQNKARIEQLIGLPVSIPCQTHSDDIYHLSSDEVDATLLTISHADAVYTQSKNQVCAIQTADCLPVFICNKEGSEVCVVHLGWRGLAKGLLLKAINNFNAHPSDMLIYIGPAISKKYFEVGAEVIDAFKSLAQLHGWSKFMSLCYIAKENQKFNVDLYEIARQECISAGISRISIHGGEYCTYSDASRFFSYRREGQCGRMLSLIWLAS